MVFSAEDLAIIKFFFVLINIMVWARSRIAEKTSGYWNICQDIWHVSQGNVATYVRYGGMSTQRCIANFLLSLSVKVFLKSAKIWQSCYHSLGAWFFGTRCISDVSFQWEGRNFDPHSSQIFHPIFLKLKTKKHIRDSRQQAKFGKDRFTDGVWADTQILAEHSGLPFFIISAKWTKWMAEIMRSFDVCACVYFKVNNK